MKLEEWIKFFERKSGEKFRHTPDLQLFFDEEKGFMLLKVVDNVLHIDQTCTKIHGQFWRTFCFDMAEANNCYKGYTYVRRNIKAYLKIFGGTIVKQGYDDYNVPVSVIEWRVHDR